jgi:hypothetical protein
MNSDKNGQPAYRLILSQQEVSAAADLISALEGGEQIAALIAALQVAIDERRNLAAEALKKMKAESSIWLGQ